MIYIPESDLLLFLGSPSVLNLEDLIRLGGQTNTHFFFLPNYLLYYSFPYCRCGLHISDIPLHDATRDLVLLSEQFEAEYKLTRDLEMLTDHLQQTQRNLEKEKQKTDTSVFKNHKLHILIM